jgi:hypothetical protein
VFGLSSPRVNPKVIARCTRGYITTVPLFDKLIEIEYFRGKLNSMNKTLDPPVLEFQTKIIGDFENTARAGRESELILNPEDFNHSLKFFQEDINRQQIFKTYLREVFKRTLDKIHNDGVFIQENHVERWRKFLNLPKKYNYSENLFDEDTGNIVCRLKT